MTKILTNSCSRVLLHYRQYIYEGVFISKMFTICFKLTSRISKMTVFCVVLILTLFAFVVTYNGSKDAIYAPNMRILQALQASKSPSYQQLITSHTTTSDTCVPLDHIYFLKTHKCGSSTVQNILLRRGLARGLNFVLPDFANYLGHPELFDPEKHVGKNLKLPSELHQFHILTHHSRYHAENVRNALPSDTKRVTILREPATLFESLYNYYGFEMIYANKTFLQIMTLPINDLTKLINSRPRFAYRVGINQMSFDLGMSNADFSNTVAIRKLVERVEKDFHLVMLSEHMEASLILLADLMCWPLEDVAFIKLNARPDTNRSPLTEKIIEKINNLSKADKLLYGYFQDRFKERVLEYGLRRMEEDISRLITINNRLFEECVEMVVSPKANNLYGVIKYLPRENAPQKCNYMVMNELDFTEHIKRKQIERFDVVRKLHNFAYS